MGLDSGRFVESGGVWRQLGSLAPGPRVTDLIESRMGKLSEVELRVVQTIAFGEPIGVDVIEGLTSSKDLAMVEDRGLTRVSRVERRLEVRLVHPLYGEVVRAQTPPLRRRAIARDLADTLETRGAKRRDDLLRLASWRLEAGGKIAPRVLLAAAGRAKAVFDYPLAERLARAAIDAGGGVETRQTLGDLLYWMGKFPEAERVLAEVDAAAETDEERSAIAISRSSNLLWGLGRPSEAEAVLTRAEAAIVDRDRRDEVVAFRARNALVDGRPLDAIEAAGSVLAHGGSDRALGWALSTAAAALALSGRTSEANDAAARGMEVALRQLEENPRLLGLMLVGQFLAHWFAGDLGAAESVAQNFYDVALAHHAQDGIASAARELGWVALARGRPKTAMRWFREAFSAVPPEDINGLQAWCLAALAQGAAVAGDKQTASECLAQAESVRKPAVRMYDSEIAMAGVWVAAGRGNLRQAARTAFAAAADAARLGQHAVEAAVLHTAVRLGHPEEAAGRLQELASTIDGRWAPLYSSQAAAMAAGDGAGLDRVAETFEAAGATLIAAEAAAAASLAHRTKGEESKARASATRSASLAARCEGSRTPALAMALETIPLTPREREIATLAAQDLSSREIAERLVLSVRTVEGHLYRLYAKLGVSDRRELATRLTPPE